MTENFVRTLKDILEFVKANNRWRGLETINLIASENVMSPLAEYAYLSDFMYRYAEGKPYKRYYQGTIFIDHIEVRTAELLAKLLEADYVELRPISGTLANATVFRVLAPPGGKAAIAPVQAGAHVSHTKYGTLGGLGIRQVELPYDEENMNIDVDKALKVLEEEKPAFLVLGGSVYLFPHPVEELADHMHSVGGKVVYDAAHVLGLIAGRKWRNPLKIGADVMTASTHKTFPGPQGGIIVTNDKELFKTIGKTVFPVFVSNHHLHRIPALAVTTVEMQMYGEKYAEQIVKNAKKLAEVLAERGLKVLGEHLGYTKSHQLLVDVSELGGGAKAATLLEKANIIVNKNLLPHDPPDAIKNPSGLRLGVQEMTRYGMREDDMEEIALFIEKVLIKKEDPEAVKKQVVGFRKNYVEIHYSIKPEDLGLKIPAVLKLM